MADQSYIDPKKRPELEQSDIIKELPKACSDEAAAVDFFEAMLWGDSPCCPKCGSVSVYKMTDAKTGERNKRYLWRCRDCKKQYTVRTRTVLEESLIPLRHWCFAFWRVSTSKKGIAALEIMRQCQISYKSALFMMHRVRWALRPDHSTAPKLTGIVEADETYVGGKPRKQNPFGPDHRTRAKWSTKTPVIGCVQRGGQIRRRVVADVNGANLKAAMKECVDPSAVLYTDELNAYRTVGKEFAGHETVNHSTYEYSRDGVNVNTMESSFALIKRSIMGIYHNVSKKHLHRYISECDFRWNSRQINDGERVKLAIKSAEGKRLVYRQPVDPAKEIPGAGHQLPLWTE